MDYVVNINENYDGNKVEHAMSYYHQQQLRNEFDCLQISKLYGRAQVSKYATVLEGGTSVGIHCTFKLMVSSCALPITLFHTY